MKEYLKKISPILVILGLLLIWELAVFAADIPAYILPAPTEILSTLAEDIDDLVRHSLVTVSEALSGMAISVVSGVIFSLIMDLFPGFKRCIYPILVVTQTVPVIVLAPILVIYMGFGWGPKILTVVLMCFFPIVVSFSDGLGGMDEGFSNLIRTYGGSVSQVYRFVKIPSAFVSLLSGLKVAATYSISGAVVGEWIASSSGLGYYLIRAKNGYEMEKVFASVLVIIILSLMMNGLVKLFSYFAVPGSRRHRRKNSFNKG
ncbi:MAG: ABC transporter permease [Lachnospiraceae bacterium]|nr:ABC transporter permease [Lachnospiraceae bacterium]